MQRVDSARAGSRLMSGLLLGAGCVLACVQTTHAATVLRPHRLRQPGHAVLRGAVGGIVGQAFEPGRRRHEEQVTALPAQHPRQERTRDGKHADQILFERPRKVRHRHLVRRAAAPATGVVDQNVHTPELRLHARGHALDLHGVHQIRRNAQRLGTEGDASIRPLLQPLAVPCNQRQAQAGQRCGEALRHRRADALGTPGDDHHRPARIACCGRHAVTMYLPEGRAVCAPST